MTDDWDLPLVTSLQCSLFLPLCLPPPFHFFTQSCSQSPISSLCLSCPPSLPPLSLFVLLQAHFKEML